MQSEEREREELGHISVISDDRLYIAIFFFIYISTKSRFQLVLPKLSNTNAPNPLYILNMQPIQSTTHSSRFVIHCWYIKHVCVEPKGPVQSPEFIGLLTDLLIKLDGLFSLQTQCQEIKS